MKNPRDVIRPRWDVFILKRKAERFAVAARNSQDAIERAIEEYELHDSARARSRQFGFA
jgi:hypothetical protein